LHLRNGKRRFGLCWEAMPELNLDDIAIFVRVVDHRGFAPAARELGVPTSTVSRAVERLETTARVRLLQRTTRALRPTLEGEELYARAAPAVSALRGAARELEPATHKPKGRLRVTGPVDLCTGFLADVIVAFAERHPHINLEFALTNQHSKLVDEGFDVAIRATANLRGASLVVRKLGVIEQRLYAAPKYLEKRGMPTSVEELQQHQCILFRPTELTRTWTFAGEAGETSVEVRGRVGGDDFSFVRAIVLAGGGIGVLPHLNSAAEEASGRLVRILPTLHLRGATLYIVYPSAKHVPTRVTAFRDFVVEAFRAWSARSATGSGAAVR
jgi:DNA-binding transcriptional LysR family regulator